MEKPSKETLENWRKDNKYWILGCFYFNPEDQRILPPKRIVGWVGRSISQIKNLYYYLLQY